MTLTHCPQKCMANRGTKKATLPPPPPTPPHSKLGCLLLPAGSSYNGISLFDGEGGAKNVVFFILSQQNFKKAI